MPDSRQATTTSRMHNLSPETTSRQQRQQHRNSKQKRSKKKTKRNRAKNKKKKLQNQIAFLLNGRFSLVEQRILWLTLLWQVVVCCSWRRWALGPHPPPALKPKCIKDEKVSLPLLPLPLALNVSCRLFWSGFKMLFAILILTQLPRRQRGEEGEGRWEGELTQVVFKFTYSIGHLVESGCRTVWQCCVASTHLQRERERRQD